MCVWKVDKQFAVHKSVFFKRESKNDIYVQYVGSHIATVRIHTVAQQHKQSIRLLYSLVPRLPIMPYATSVRHI